MAKLRVPSLLHMARNWRESPLQVKKELIRLATNPPTWGYNALYGAINDLLRLNVPYDQVVNGIKTKVTREKHRKALLEILPLIRDHFDELQPDSIIEAQQTSYSAGQGLRIPFQPPILYFVGGEIYLPLFVFWRSNPVVKKKLSLLVTILDDLQRQNPDIEAAKVKILDFSRPSPKDKRSLRITDAQDIERLDMAEVHAMLEIFRDGFFAAVAELDILAQAAAAAAKEKPEKRDPNRPGLFDDE